MVLNTYNISEELVVFLRNQDILSTTQRGVTTAAQSFTANGSTSTFDVTNSATLKNVRTVTVNGSTQTPYTNYTANYETSPVGRIVFTSTPALNATVSVSYDYGPDKIFTDFPRVDLDASSYPRVSCAVTATRDAPLAISGTTTLSDVLVSMTIFDPKIKGTMDKVTAVRSAVNSYRKSFQNFTYIRPNGESRVLEDPNRRAKIMQKTIDWMIPEQVENV